MVAWSSPHLSHSNAMLLNSGKPSASIVREVRMRRGFVRPQLGQSTHADTSMGTRPAAGYRSASCTLRCSRMCIFSVLFPRENACGRAGFRPGMLPAKLPRVIVDG